MALARPYGQPLAPAAAQVRCKVASERSEREAAFRLLYDSYTHSGLIQPNPQGMRVTPYHLLSSTEMFVAKLHEQVICTVSLVGDGELGLPMEAIYPEIVAERRGAGIRCAEVSALADRRSDIERFFPMFLKLIQVMLPYSYQHGVQQALIAVHPRHARFYERFLKFQPIGEERAYPHVQNHPAVALCLDYAWLRETHPKVFREFVGRSIQADELRSCPMSHEERAYFKPAASFYDNAAKEPSWSSDGEHVQADQEACAA